MKNNNIINNHLKSMLEVAFEYVGQSEEVESIYVFCSIEESLFFNYFYMINGEVVKKHLINNYLSIRCDVSDEQQDKVLDIGFNDLEGIINEFKREKKELPSQIYITYYVKDKSMDANFNYDNKLIGTDLTEFDLIQKWIEELNRG